MKIFRLVFWGLVLLSTSTFGAQTSSIRRFSGFSDNLWGYGLFLGEPVGAQVHYFANWKKAWSFTGGYSQARVFAVSADYLFYAFDASDKLRTNDFWNSLVFYAGPGLKGGLGLSGSDPADNTQFGLRIIGGSEYVFTGSPWSVRVELGPEFLLKGRSNFNFAMGVGVTYYMFDRVKPYNYRTPTQQPIRPQVKPVAPVPRDSTEAEFE